MSKPYRISQQVFYLAYKGSITSKTCNTSKTLYTFLLKSYKAFIVQIILITIILIRTVKVSKDYIVYYRVILRFCQVFLV